MLARRLSSSQSLSSEVGTLARYVTTSGNLSLDPTSSSLTHPRRHLGTFPATYAPKPTTTRRPTRDLGQAITRNGTVLSACSGWRQITTTAGWNRSDQDENQPHNQAAVEQPLRDETRHPEPRTPLALDDELKKWLDSPPEAPKDHANAGSYVNKPAVLVVKGASKSLLETDFYRLAPQGHHLDGWAGGIQRVVQQRHPDTQEPLGQYFLFFSTYTAALAYEQNFRHLHEISRRSLPDTYRANVGVAEGVAPTHNDETVAANLRSFTILPPSATPRLRLYSAKHLAKAIRDLEREQQQRSKVTGRDRDALSMSQIRAAREIQGVLGKLANEGEEPLADHARVLVRLDGGKTTAETLRAAIDSDGLERNLAWRLVRDGEVVSPLAASAGWARPNSTSDEDFDSVPGDEVIGPLFARFVVNFAETAEARRFVRAWHKRELWDERTDRMMVVNASALW